MKYQHSGSFYCSYKNNEIYAIAENYESSIRTDKDFIKYLSNLNYKGSVNIDMLLKNGNTSKRYLTILFDGKEFLKKSMKVYTKIEEFEEFNFEFFKKNSKLIENSILTRNDIVSIKNHYLIF